MKLTEEEKRYEEAIGRKQYKVLPKSELKVYQAAAQRTVAKDARINVRIPAADLDQIRSMARHEGLPYQSLIAGVLHKFAQRSFIDLDDLASLKRALKI